jgi:hypothetical protein
MSQYSGEFSWQPQLRRSNTIRNLSFGTNVDYFNDGNGRIETRSENVTLGVQFENGGSVNFGRTQTFDRLVTAFPIRSNVSIPAGDYQYGRYSARFDTGSNRKIGVTGSVGWGGFWDGDNSSFSGGLEVRPNYHLNLDLSFSRNQVTLPHGSFTTQLVGARILYGFTPRASFNAFIQYNADTRQVSSNLRFDLIHRPLSNLYVVYNDRRDTSHGQLIERALIVKLTNLFTF